MFLTSLYLACSFAMSHIKMLGIHPVRTRLTQHSLVVRGRLMLNHFGYTYLKTENKNKLSIEGT